MGEVAVDQWSGGGGGDREVRQAPFLPPRLSPPHLPQPVGQKDLASGPASQLPESKWTTIKLPLFSKFSRQAGSALEAGPRWGWPE